MGSLQLEVGPLVLNEVQYTGHCVFHFAADATTVAVVTLLPETTARLLLLLTLLTAVVRSVVHVK